MIPLDEKTVRNNFLAMRCFVRDRARFAFRFVHCPYKREDLVADVIAAAWMWCSSLAKRGKDATRFPVALTHLAIRWVRSGRRLTGPLSPKDAMSSRAQERHGFQTSLAGKWIHALTDESHKTTPAELASFRVDFDEWVRQQPDRRQRLVKDMAHGERTLDLSKRYGMSPARVSQIRRELDHNWKTFQGESVAA